jgi:hypothetical protein
MLPTNEERLSTKVRRNNATTTVRSRRRQPGQWGDAVGSAPQTAARADRARRLVRGFGLKLFRLVVRGLMRDLAGDLTGCSLVPPPPPPPGSPRQVFVRGWRTGVPMDRSSSVGWRTFIVPFCPVSASSVHCREVCQGSTCRILLRILWCFPPGPVCRPRRRLPSIEPRQEISCGDRGRFRLDLHWRPRADRLKTFLQGFVIAQRSRTAGSSQLLGRLSHHVTAQTRAPVPKPPSRNNAPIMASMVFESMVFAPQAAAVSPRLRRR